MRHSYSCTTEFDEQYRPFYVFRMKNRRKIIGTIPAGIDIVYMRRRLHTVDAVQRVHEIYVKTGRLPSALASYSSTTEVWYDSRGDFNKKLFYIFLRGLKEP